MKNEEMKRRAALYNDINEIERKHQWRCCEISNKQAKSGNNQSMKEKWHEIINEKA